jgi:hypothetical protein
MEQNRQDGRGADDISGTGMYKQVAHKLLGA